jgi:formylglycine-generating enzyme required for sulfatase activity
MRSPLTAYKPFLDAVNDQGVLRLGVYEHIILARLIEAAQAGQWTRAELGDAVASALSTSSEKWQDLRRLYEHHAPNESHSLPMAAGSSGKWLLRRRSPWLRDATRRGERFLRAHRRWAALFLFALAYLLGERALRERHVPVPRQEHCLPVVPEKTRPDSRYLKRPLPRTPQATEPRDEPLPLFVPSLRVWAELASGATALILLGILLLRLWPHLRRRLETRLPAAHAEAEQRRQREEEQRQKGQQLLTLAEQAAYTSGQNIRPHYGLDLAPPVPAEVVEDTATLLGRVYQAARGFKVNVPATLAATLRAGGEPRLVLLPRRRTAELLVLYDEWDTRPYLPGFLKLLDRWQRLGVNLSRWRFEKHPQKVSPSAGNTNIDLEDLLRRHDDAPVVIFASRLDLQGFDTLQQWPRLLRTVGLRAWLDPDPRPAELRNYDERRDIERLTPLLPRFGLTPTGLKALARFLQQQGRGAAIPGWESLEVTDKTPRAIEKWMAFSSQVPDASYQQLEAVRQRLLSGELADARAMRLLIERLARELGAGYRLHVPTVELSSEQQIAFQRWLYQEEPELFEAGFALLDEAMGETPPGMESGQPTLLTWEWLRRKRGYQAGQQRDSAKREQILAELVGTPVHEQGQLLLQQFQAVYAPTAQTKTPLPARVGWREARVLRYFGVSPGWALATTALVLALVLFATFATRSIWLAETLPKRAVRVTVVPTQDYDLEKADIFPKTQYRPALWPIPAGKFLMGSPKGEPDHQDDEVQHEVELTYPFLMMETEVTQGQYAAAMAENPSAERKDWLDSDCKSAGVGDELPVYCVDFIDAVKYANWLSRLEKWEGCYELDGNRIKWPKGQQCIGYRLPTEAEWEYAARGGQTQRYSGSNNPDESAWYSNNANGQAHAVGKKKANEWGLHDMSGNVVEWVWDWFAAYQLEDKKDPMGPLQGGPSRVFRGGSWGFGARFVRVSNRGRTLPGLRPRFVGFRLVRSYP